jgi:ribose 5-phosphate isomerase B
VTRIALGADDDGELVRAIDAHLRAAGHEVVVPVPVGTAWPDVGRAVGEAVARGEVDTGIVCCWTGTGVSIAANKVPGARAALCDDAVTADGARRWNDANVLALSMRTTTAAAVGPILDAFLGGQPDEHERANFSRLDS